jgi:hypothetical protein
MWRMLATVALARLLSPRPALEKPKNQAAKVAGKKAYRKPKLRRLGQLKSVAGSGITW